MKVRELQKQLQEFVDNGGNPNAKILLPTTIYDFRVYAEMSGFHLKKMHKNGKYYDLPKDIKQEQNSVDRMIFEFWQ